MKRRILSLLLVLVLIGSMIPTVYAASSATIIRAVDNNPNLGKKTFDLTITFKSDGNAGSGLSGNNGDESYFTVFFPRDVKFSSVSKYGASDASDGTVSNDYYFYRVYLGKNFMITSGDTITITFKGIDALPYRCQVHLAKTTANRSFTGDLTVKVNGSTYHTYSNLGGKMEGKGYDTKYFDPYPNPTSSVINLSTSSVTAPLNSTSTITYTVYSQSSMTRRALI